MISKVTSSRASVWIFLSGRVIGVAVGFLFQILLVHILPIKEYASYSAALASALLLQWAVSFGLLRSISKFGSLYITSGAWRGFTRLLIVAASFRVLLSIFLAAFLPSLLTFLFTMDENIYLFSAIYIITWSSLLSVYDELQGTCQLLMLQHLSRVIAIVEPLARTLGLITIFINLEEVVAADVVLIYITTLALSCLLLAIIIGLFLRTSLRRVALQRAGRVNATFGGIARFAIASYTSSLGAFMVSPPVVRLVLAAVLSIEAFAAFSFVQALVSSLLRVTPGIILTSFVEPFVLRDFATSGSPAKLQSILALIFKIDLALFAVLAAFLGVCSPVVLALLSGGRFLGYDWLLPVLIPMGGLFSLFRGLETATIALGLLRPLISTIAIGTASLFALFVLAPISAFAAAIGISYLDLICRSALLGYSVSQRGVRLLLDFRFMGVAIGASAVCGVVGRMIVQDMGVWAQLAAGALAALIALGMIAASRPLRSSELILIIAANQHRFLNWLARQG